MKYKSNIAAIEDLALSEGGVFTTAQAARLAIPRDALSYASRSGHIERVIQGAYRLTAAGDDGLDELRAIYKMTAPAKFSIERSAAGEWDGIAVCGPTAAYILGIGDFFAAPYYLFAPKRINSRKRSVRFVRADVPRKDVVWEAGLPVMRVEATIASLAWLREDPSLVADAFVDVVRKHGSTTLDIRKLEEMLGREVLVKVEADAGIFLGGPRRLVHLDALGHVAIAEGTQA